MSRRKIDRSRFSRRDFFKVGAVAFASTGASVCAESAPSANSDSASDAPRFERARPVWALGRAEEMNVTLLFKAEFDLPKRESYDDLVLRATCSSIMRVRVNGEYAGYGPARGPKGWYRVDETPIGAFVKSGRNVVEIEAASYNSVSYYLLSQPGFLQAEIVDGSGSVRVATAPDGAISATPVFEARDLTGVRVQKVQRHGWHRTFIEVYDYGKRGDVKRVALEERPDVPLLPRRAPYAEFAILPVVGWLKRGTLAIKENFEPWRGNPLTGINEKFTGYKLDELDLILTDELMKYRTNFVKNAEPLGFGSTYREGDVQIVDFGANYACFWGLTLETSEDAEIALTFDEVLSKEGDVNFMRCNTCNATKWTLPGGERYDLETFEPQCARYVKIYCLKGSFALRNLYAREYAAPATRDASFACSDPRIDEIYNAAVLTYRANAVDAFTDCPHRERAGWMCDSFFTARAAFDLTGATAVESAVFENYALPKSFPNLPDGATPMCYPSDTWHGQFIPNWMMWMVLELEEYLTRSQDAARVESMRARIAAALAFLAQYENSDGLLEKLPNRVFVEWSDANKFLQDVNYPTNMLYAAALESASRLFAVDEYAAKAARIRAKIREQAYDGTFFVDHARRESDGTLTVLDDKSEVCQYFAFYFGTATSEDYPELWRKLLDEFGPKRVDEGRYPDVKKANAFVGNMMRFELLSRAKRCAQILDEMVEYYAYMAERTGTLWENVGATASCNHGFASHVARILYRDALGIRRFDPSAGVVEIFLPKIDALEFARGAIPTPKGPLTLEWTRRGDAISYDLTCPEAYRSSVSVAEGLTLARK